MSSTGYQTSLPCSGIPRLFDVWGVRRWYPLPTWTLWHAFYAVKMAGHQPECARLPRARCVWSLHMIMEICHQYRSFMVFYRSLWINDRHLSWCASDILTSSVWPLRCHLQSFRAPELLTKSGKECNGVIIGYICPLQLSLPGSYQPGMIWPEQGAVLSSRVVTTSHSASHPPPSPHESKICYLRLPPHWRDSPAPMNTNSNDVKM